MHLIQTKVAYVAGSGALVEFSADVGHYTSEFVAKLVTESLIRIGQCVMVYTDHGNPDAPWQKIDPLNFEQPSLY